MNHVLVAGIGNIFLGDDAFGVEVAARLRARPLGAGVRVEDFGIRGIDLMYALMDDLDAVILVDAVQRGEAPGTLYVIDPAADGDEAGSSVDAAPTPLLAAHDTDPATVLRLARAFGAHCPCVRLVGCEPASFGTEDDGDGRMGLSAPVAAAIEAACDTVTRLIAGLEPTEPAGRSALQRGFGPASNEIALPR